jgi:NAD(P)-dependent dehydrogenase (short-subunit alcohol dehydrogenase family)
MHVYQNSLAGRVALVTGAGSGIGKATALLLAQAGARVAVLTRNEHEAEEVCAEIRRAGGEEPLKLIADISHAEEMETAIAAIHARWQKLDIVVANAGINGFWAPVDEIPLEEWEKTLRTNLTGTFLTIKPALPFMKTTGGSIVIVASVNGTRIFSNAGASAYAVSKAGQVAFGRMLALELSRHRIRVNTICPGSISTRIDESVTRKDLDKIHPPVEFPEGTVPLTSGRPGTAAQVAELVWFLASDASSHITGTEVFIDGAESLLMG